MAGQCICRKHRRSEVYTLRFKNLDTGEMLAGEVKGVYYSATWAADSRTFFYTTLDETKRPWQVWRCWQDRTRRL